MGRGFSEDEIWVVGSSIGVKGWRDGLRKSMLLLIGFGDGVKCSRSLLYRLPLSILWGVVFLGEDRGVVQLIMISEVGKW